MPAWEGGPQTGSSKGAAKTRQQLLEQAHADRDARKTERLRLQCAIQIQCSWRVYKARVSTLQTVRIRPGMMCDVLSAVGLSVAHSVPDRGLLCRYVSKLSEDTGRRFLPPGLAGTSAKQSLQHSCSMTSLSGSQWHATSTAMVVRTKEAFLGFVERISRARFRQPWR